jgi:hypothetical protein
MDVFSKELGIQLSFVKTSEIQGGLNPPPWYTTVTVWSSNTAKRQLQLIPHYLIN